MSNHLKIDLKMSHSQRKRIVLIWILLFLLINSFTITYYKLDIIDNHILVKNTEKTFLENSNFYNLTGSSILIDDTDPNYNWSKTAAEND